MSYRIVRKLASAQTLSLVVVASLIVVGLLHMRPVYGDQLPTRSIEFARGEPGITDSFKLGLTIPANETLGSIRIQFCVESPLIGQPCTLPTGMDISGVNLIGQTGITNFTVLSSSGDSVVLTRSAALVFPVDATFTFSGVVNPANAGSYFGRIQTYVSQDATGASTDYGGLAFAMEEAVQISATVPPYLYFCAGSLYTEISLNKEYGGVN